jgi:hypothetical protein
MFKECGEKHAPGKCDAFKKLSPQQRLKVIEERELCHLCYRHLQGRECWSKDKVPNCGVDGCQAAHHHLLHSALVQGCVWIVQEIGAKKAGVLCREDVRVRSAEGTTSLHALYDWGATVTLVTHAAAEKGVLERKRQVAAAVAGLDGRCTTVDSYYMVPEVDGDDAVRVVRALGVDHIATLAAAGLRGEACAASRRCGDVDRHGQPGMDARACGEKPAGKRQPAADAVRAEPTLHSDGERQDAGAGERHSGE